MSLERVGGEFQGAVYPLSIEPAAGAGDVRGAARVPGFAARAICTSATFATAAGGRARTRGRSSACAGAAICRRASPRCGPRRAAFRIRFTAPVDRERAAGAANYSVSSYRRVATPAYGGPDQDRRVEKIVAVQVSDDALEANIELESLREGFVYEFHVRDLARGQPFFPAEAYYTLRHLVD